MSTTLRRRQRLKRKQRVKLKVQKHTEKPRLTVFKTAKHIYAQIISDQDRKTLVSESTVSKLFKESKKYGGNVDAAKWVGNSIGEQAAKQGIKEICYDRNGFIYTGRVKALADAVREKGIKF